MFYKGKYLIGLYDLEDNFINVFDNANQLAKYLKKSVLDVYKIFYVEKRNNIKKHNINGRWVQVKLIPIEEKEK